MDIKSFLDIVCNRIKYKPIRKDIAKELELHIQEIKEDYLEQGHSEKEAEERAVSQMGAADEIGKNLNKIHKPKLDWKLLILICISVFFGILVAKSDGFFTYNMQGELLLESNTFQGYLFSILIATLLSILIYFIDYRRLCKHSLKLYILAFGINLVAFCFGTKSGGTILWGLPFVNVSPTVFSIPLYIVAFAGFITNITKKEGMQINSNIVKIIVLSIFSIISLLMINNISAFITIMVYLIIATIQLSKLKSNKIKNIAKLWGMSIILFLLLAFIFMEPYENASRVETIIYQFFFEADTEYKTQLNEERKEILNSAKLFGKTDAVDITTKSHFEMDSNFAFISLLANYGWVVSLGMVSFIILLNIKLILNALKTKDYYGKLIIIGIASKFILETILNLAISFGLDIIADFSIPLVSLGKTSLIINMMCLALVLAVYRRKDINIYNKCIQEESN